MLNGREITATPAGTHGPEWKKLVAKTSMHAIYDDHDFGMDDCVPGAQVDHPTWKKPVLENFINNWNNPSVGGGDRIPVVGRLFFGAGAVHHVGLPILPRQKREIHAWDLSKAMA